MDMYHICTCVFIHVLHCWADQTTVDGKHCEVKGKRRRTKTCENTLPQNIISKDIYPLLQ